MFPGSRETSPLSIASPRCGVSGAQTSSPWSARSPAWRSLQEQGGSSHTSFVLQGPILWQNWGRMQLLPPTLWPWLEPAHELPPPEFPAQLQGTSHSKKHLEGEGREMLGGGTRQAAGMITAPSPGPEHAGCPWMQKADTPVSSLNETHSALLGFKYAFSQPDPSCP